MIGVIAIVALFISLALVLNEMERRKSEEPKTVSYFFENEQVATMYQDEQSILNFPHYGSSQAAGFDIRANQTIILDPGQFMLVKTGLFFDLPEDHELQIRPRSGLAAKYGITVLNSPGTVDSDYTGEVKVILTNTGANRYTVKYGERIAQGVFAKTTERPVWNRLTSKDQLGLTERGKKGFGSTGTK